MKKYKKLIVATLAVIIISSGFFLYKTKDKEERIDTSINSSCLNMIQILLCVKEQNSRSVFKNLFSLYKNKNIYDAQLLVSPFMPNKIYEKYYDKFIHYKVDNFKLFDYICCYIVKKDSQTGKFIVWDKYSPSLKLKEMPLQPKSSSYFKELGTAFKVYGVPKDSSLRKIWPKEAFYDAEVL